MRPLRLRRGSAFEPLRLHECVCRELIIGGGGFAVTGLAVVEDPLKRLSQDFDLH